MHNVLHYNSYYGHAAITAPITPTSPHTPNSVADCAPCPFASSEYYSLWATKPIYPVLLQAAAQTLACARRNPCHVCLSGSRLPIHVGGQFCLAFPPRASTPPTTLPPSPLPSSCTPCLLRACTHSHCLCLFAV